ncbi:hydrolase [Arthrobacter sp. H35-D1]|uniref:hydrolase n=1 Tax=Arthrobacter sp. H35-D1 TaxID=3046202 RepID=UPI0024BAEA25|nr:hydrolase [Arthrobacter sp. H35-D1]MDJ0312847.1 hydrolase [Arthrobacter sp. H35-D1]
MTIWTCATCAIEHTDTTDPPQVCEICSDERQYVPATGQRWTTRDELEAEGFRITVVELEPGLHAVETMPELGIGQRGLLVQTEHGNLLWEPPGFLDNAGIEAVRALGGVAVVAASHPHLTGSSIQWSHAFGRAPVYVAAADRQWIRRPDPAIRLWEDVEELLPGLAMHQFGGHFAGSSMVHWLAGAQGHGALLAGDTVGIGRDRKSVNAMRSYVNNIPLPARAIRRILDTSAPLAFERIYGAFATIDGGAKDITERSLRRYIDWVTDTVPDE